MKKLAFTFITALSLSTTSIAADTSVAGSNSQMKFIDSITERGCTLVTGNTSIIDLGPHTVNNFAAGADGKNTYTGSNSISRL